MRILHVVQGYTPAIGGTERLIQKASEQLVARHQDEVTVFTTTAYNCELFWRNDQPELPAGTEIINGVAVRRYRVFNKFNKLRRVMAGTAYKLHLPFNDRLRALYNGPLIPSLTHEIATARADIIAASSFPLLHMHYALRGGRKSGTPVVFYGGIHTADDFGFDRPMIYQAINEADAYIAYTTFERDYLINERGVLPDKITVVGVGVDQEPFEQGNGRLIRDRFGWGNEPVVAFVGQQVPHKGIDMVLEAMKQIWQELPETCLLIAGAQTSYSPTLKNQVAQLSPELQMRVAVIDDFVEEEKPAIFAACDLLAFPSGNESFGIVFLEAWAAKKPVVGARIGAVPTVVNEGKDGLLIEHRNTNELVQAIRTLLVNPELRNRFGAAGYHKVRQNYTWDIVADKFRAVYVKSLQNRPHK